MTQSGFVLSDPAVGDLRDIRDHIARDDPDTARQVLNDIRAAIQRLVDLPHLGHVRQDLADEQLRVWTVHTYLVIYLPDTSPLQVVRVLSGYRDLTAILD